MRIFCRYTTETEQWIENNKYEITDNIKTTVPNIEIKNKIYYQTLDEKPWGGCFADRGYMAMQKLTDEQRRAIITSFFGKDGLCFTAARVPMGNNDFSDTHKSYNEHSGDYNMERFSIKTDEAYLLPYIKTALEINPNISFFATPWSPPSWMKHNHKIHGIDENNKIIFEPEVLKAYAKYFVKYIQEYSKLGIHIDAVNPQNEPTINSAYASCIWDGKQLNIFIRDYLYPAFCAAKLDTKIWLGTFTDSNAALAVPSLEDRQTINMIDAVCFQWGGAPLATVIEKAYGKRIIQSETKCGDGKNDWNYAMEQFDCFKEFFEAGAQSYYIWNMVLDESGANTAQPPWHQNAPVTVNSKTSDIRYNPSYYLTKHFSYYIKPRARRIRLDGTYSNAIAFENPDGEIVILVKNDNTSAQEISMVFNNKTIQLTLKESSVNTIIIKD